MAGIILVGLDVIPSPVFARHSYEVNNLLQSNVRSLTKSLLADPAAVVGPAVAAVEVALPALGHR